MVVGVPIFFFRHDRPVGCFLAEEDGERAAMVTTTSYGSSGWIGNLIVVKERRSRGLGRALMERAIEYLRSRSVETVRLDADPDGVPLYKSLGFITTYRSLRYEGRAAGEEAGAVRVMAPADLDEVCRLDARLFGADRSRVLRRLYRDIPELAFVTPPQGAVTGYLMARQMDGGIRIGPAVVDVSGGETGGALPLMRALFAACPGTRIRTGLPEGNIAGREMLEEIGFREAQGCLRMRLGPEREGETVESIFGIGSGAKG